MQHAADDSLTPDRQYARNRNQGVCPDPMTRDHATRNQPDPPSTPACPPAEPRRLGATPSLLAAIPHLPAFWPSAATVTLSGSPLGLDMEWVAAGAAPATDLPALRFDEGPFPAPAFAGRRAPVILFAAPLASGDPLDALLGAAAQQAPAPDTARARAASLRERIVHDRLGGIPGLPDPGPRALQTGPAEAVIVIDPCDPMRAAATCDLWIRAQAGAEGRPVIAVRAPGAPGAAPATLDATRGARLAAWTILDAAAALHTLDDTLGLLGLMAGRPVRCDPASPYASWAEGGTRDGLDLLATIAERARCVDPFSGHPVRFEDALDLLALWRRAEEANRRIAVCVGMSFWKRERIAATLASARGTPAFRRRARDAVAEAARRGGGIAVWASRCPPDLPGRARAAGIPLLQVEDGFIRSAGLGADFLPGASVTLDSRAPYYDPSVQTDLEHLLATAEFPPPLLARAERLVATLRARQVTKYNLGGELPALPAASGRKRILVPGQVADDLSVLRGAAGPVRDDRSLLAAARAAEPDACLIYKPHPDVLAGHRPGGIAAEDARRHADLIVTGGSIAALLDAVDAVHTLTSLAGFEALIRGRAVTAWGQPFYAGWGLTEDRAPILRRARRLGLAELVAGALILYPRYIDPVTELPCPPEALLERLSNPALWQAGPVMRLRRLQGVLRGAMRRQRRRMP